MALTRVEWIRAHWRRTSLQFGLWGHHDRTTRAVRLGTRYGGWWVPEAALRQGSICYTAGLGEDGSFDVLLVKRFGARVWAIDPTPRAIAYARTIAQHGIQLVPKGLWSSDVEMRFYEPADPAHVSHSIVNAQATEAFFTASCATVRSVMADLGHDRVDLLKLDIEGAEVAVIEDLLENGPLPTVLCVECDAPEAVRVTLRRIGALRARGYCVVKCEGRNVTLMRDSD